LIFSCLNIITLKYKLHNCLPIKYSTKK